MRTGPIHDALAAKGLAPSELLVDSAYVSAEHLVGARERHGIDLFGPARPDQRVGRSRWRAPFRPPTLWWIGSAAACAVRKVMKARPGGRPGTKPRAAP